MQARFIWVRLVPVMPTRHGAFIELGMRGHLSVFGIPDPVRFRYLQPRSLLARPNHLRTVYVPGVHHNTGCFGRLQMRALMMLNALGVNRPRISSLVNHFSPWPHFSLAKSSTISGTDQTFVISFFPVYFVNTRSLTAIHTA